jgi:hypothetical protein
VKKNLTLKLKKSVIIEAKKYASERGLSLSDLVQNHLHQLTTDENEEFEITPLVKSLSGILDLGDNFGYKAWQKRYEEKMNH